MNVSTRHGKAFVSQQSVAVTPHVNYMSEACSNGKVIDEAHILVRLESANGSGKTTIRMTWEEAMNFVCKLRSVL